MSDTYTFSFNDPQNPTIKFTATVKSSFLEKCPEIDKVKHPTEYETEYGVSEYFHNPVGPALVVTDGEKILDEEYWMDGKHLDEKETEQLKHSIKFNNKLENIINT